jgi:hypothetical protein
MTQETGSAAIEAQLPLKLGVLELCSLGRIEYERKEFHNERNIFPIGFKSERLYASYRNNNERVTYICEILDAGEHKGHDALFRVTPTDDPDGQSTSTSASGAWLPIIKRVGKTTKKGKRSTFTVSGTHFFGLSIPKVRALIEKLPNAEKCENYIKFRGDQPNDEEDEVVEEEEEELPPRRKKEDTTPRTPLKKKKKERIKPTCKICWKNDTPKQILTCSKCSMHMHSYCHLPSLASIPDHLRSEWRCDDCKYCTICDRDDNDEMLLLCEICDRGFHTFCMPTPLTEIPEGSWLCTDCSEEIVVPKPKKKPKIVYEEKEKVQETKIEEIPPQPQPQTETLVAEVEDVTMTDDDKTPVDEKALLEYLLPDFVTSMGRTIIDLPAFGFFAE